MRVFHSGRVCAVGMVAIFGLSLQPTFSAERPASIPDLSGQWGRDMFFFEPPPSGPGPVAILIRKPDGSRDTQAPCCAVRVPNPNVYGGDHTNAILKPEAAQAVQKLRELAESGVVTPDLHNSCWPEPPPFSMALNARVEILQRNDEITLIYEWHNTVRHVRLNVSHPNNLVPSWQGHSVGWYEGDTLVIDTVGIKVAPLSTVDPFGTPHSAALHVVERYRLIGGETAAQAQQRNGARTLAGGRAPVDPDPAKKGLQVDFTVEDDAVFTTPWSARVTYRPVLGEWAEVLCVENPFVPGINIKIPTANSPDF